MSNIKMNAVFENNIITSEDMMEEPEMIDSPIKDFLRNKSVFLTGGTGFLGKLMIQKLLRCDVKEIFLLTRPKKGVSSIDRLEKVLSEPIFVKINENKEEYIKKLKIIEGDLSKLQLGLSSIDRQVLIDNVQIVFHVAADVRFDESLKESLETNVRGTREILLLAQSILNLEVFLYVSTAFCTPVFDVKEKFYKSHMDPDFMVKMVEQLKPEEFDNFQALAKRIIDPFPNTYTYTKSLSEQVVRKYAKNMCIAIIRPSIVTTTYQDPIPGWTDNIYGLNGVVTGAGIGVLRILHIDNKKRADVVPADCVVNSCIALAWYTWNQNKMQHNNNTVKDSYEEKDKEHEIYYNYEKEKIQIYHCTAQALTDEPLTWEDIKEKTTAFGKKYPIQKSLWIVRYNTTKYYYMSQFLKIFYHFIPAFIVDSYFIFNKKEPRLLKLYRKVNKFSEVISFFTTNQWSYDHKNMRKVVNELTPYDRNYFNCDLKNVSWWEFFSVYTVGLRRYIALEGMDNIELALKRNRKLTMIHHTLMSILYAFLLYLGFQILCFYKIIESDLFRF